MTKQLTVSEIATKLHKSHYDTIDGTDGCESAIHEATQALKALVTEMVEKALEPNEWHDTEGEYGLKCNGKGECRCYASYVNHYTLPKRLERAKAKIERRFE